jgi:hypothetical protein
VSHRTRPIKPGRLWDADYGPLTDHPLDPRNDSETPEEAYEVQLALARLRKRDQQRQQEKR